MKRFTFYLLLILLFYTPLNEAFSAITVTAKDIGSTASSPKIKVTVDSFPSVILTNNIPTDITDSNAKFVRKIFAYTSSSAAAVPGSALCAMISGGCKGSDEICVYFLKNSQRNTLIPIYNTAGDSTSGVKEYKIAHPSDITGITNDADGYSNLCVPLPEPEPTFAFAKASDHTAGNKKYKITISRTGTTSQVVNISANPIAAQYKDFDYYNSYKLEITQLGNSFCGHYSKKISSSPDRYGSKIEISCDTDNSISFLKVSSYDHVFKFRGDHHDFSFWKPRTQTGYYPIGHVVVNGINSGEPTSHETLLVTGNIIAPASYSNQWSTYSIDENHTDGTIWKPNPAVGYTCIGDISVSGESNTQPSLSTNVVACIPSSCAELVGVGAWLGDDAGSGADRDVSIYGAHSGTFVSNRNQAYRIKPSCLKYDN